jgi:hypothetical protein
LAERLFWEQEAAGSNPVTPIKRAPHQRCGALLTLPKPFLAPIGRHYYFKNEYGKDLLDFVLFYDIVIVAPIYKFNICS